jgi:hypothetical protein
MQDGQEQPTRPRRKGHHTQWAAQFAVASELCKRGYEVSFTMGNSTPLADLMVVSPAGQMFLVDVKGVATRTCWLVSRKVTRDSLFYVFAFVPSGDTQNQFFIMTHAEVNEAIHDGPMPDVRWNDLKTNEDAWHLLPQ